MGSSIRTDINLAWPTAEIAVWVRRGRQYRLSAGACAAGDQAAVRRKVAEFRDRFANPFVAAERGYIDDDRATRKQAARDSRSPHAGE
jgi:propionyl-CoA carboxylase beta chain